MISHKYQCIFIHIPKTAGTSIEKKLGQFEKLAPGVQDHRSIRELEPQPAYGIFTIRNKDDLKFLRYRAKSTLKGRETLTSAQYRNYFKFTFVRNPWSRVFSWYKAVMRLDHVKKRFGISDECSLSEFVSSYMHLQPALRPQLFWITDSQGRNPMDFIGRYENLSDDFAHVCDVLQIEDPELPQLLAGDKRHYTDYFDAQTRDVIWNRYREEIDCFGFNFGE
jgi:hypothetical protein